MTATERERPIDEDVAATPEGRWTRLRGYNVVMGLLHLAQGIVVLILANDFSLPVTASLLDGPPGITDPEFTELFRYSVAWGVALFLFMSAAAHFTVSSPGVFGWYKRGLMHDRNYARWIEYSFSSSLMIILIAGLSGISDIAAILGLAGVNASMILFGWLMEKYEIPGRPNWLSYAFGCLAGAIPWVAILVYLLQGGEVPGFVWGIFFSLFVFFNTFAVNMILQYRRIGPWRNYLFGESAYVFLSLTAKSLLAWQIFAGTLTI